MRPFYLSWRQLMRQFRLPNTLRNCSMEGIRPISIGSQWVRARLFFQEYVKDATIRLKGNPKYWKPNEVQLSKLVFDITPEAAVRAQKLKANECQVMTSPRLTDIPAL